MGPAGLNSLPAFLRSKVIPVIAMTPRKRRDPADSHPPAYPGMSNARVDVGRVNVTARMV